jgi:Reverse transcriptase (RNA-dependent DNA polymerase)/Integrase core domain
VHVSIPLQTVQPMNTVFIDSCAGASVFSDPEFFISMEEPRGSVAVHFGPGDPIPVLGIGTVSFSFEPDSGAKAHERQVAVLHGIYYVPQQHMNLLSVNTLHEHGSGANFDTRPGHVRISTEKGDSFVKAQWENNLPFLPVSHAGLLNPKNITVNAVRRAIPPDLKASSLHARFGHVGAQKLKRLVDAGYLDASDVDSLKGLDCDTCLTANAQKEPYPTVDHQATHPNHVFHADVLYMPERTLDGKDYVLVVVDEYTRYVFVSLLRSRSQAGDALLTIFRRAETLHDKRVKYFRTDLGGEFCSQLMQTAKAELGMSDQHVPAECHSSNGFVERANKTLQRMVRAMLEASKFPHSYWGEFLLAAVHVYNLLPHTQLVNKASSVPAQLYLGETDDRLQRLYNQLVPIGIQCAVVDISDGKRKLDARSQPGYIVGYGPSTQQYRVLVRKDEQTYRHMLVRHVTITGAHHNEFFSRKEAPVDIPFDSLVRHWHPGMADIRVQECTVNQTLSLGPNALDGVSHTGFGYSRMQPLFLMHRSFLEGACNPSLNATNRAADPTGDAVDFMCLRDTFLDPRPGLARTPKQQAAIFQGLIYHLIPRVCCSKDLNALKPILTPAEYELYQGAHRLAHSHKVLGRNSANLPRLCNVKIQCKHCVEEAKAEAIAATAKWPGTRELIPVSKPVLSSGVKRVLRKKIEPCQQKRPLRRSPASSVDTTQQKIAKFTTDLLQQETSSPNTSSLLGKELPSPDGNKREVTSEDPCPASLLDDIDPALLDAFDPADDEFIASMDNPFNEYDPSVPDCVVKDAVYTDDSPPKQCGLKLTNTEGEVNCTGDGTVESSGTIQVCNAQAKDEDDPTLEQALSSVHKSQWVDALVQEIQSMIDSEVFELVDRPSKANVVKCKWVLKIKRNPDGSVDKFKGRLVAKGFSQREGIDYFELWSPTGHHATLKCLFVYAVQYNYKVRHVDIKCAFLNGDLEEEVFMEQPPMFDDGTGRVWRLRKSIYGLKQASRQWHKKLKEVLGKLGFKRASYDPALFVDEATHSIFIFMWVDDLFIVAEDVETNRVIDGILHEFQGRDLGEASWMLGMEVTHDHESCVLKITQRRMIHNMLERFGFDKGATMPTPVEVSHHIVPNPYEVSISKLEGQLKVERNEKKIASLQNQLRKFKADTESLSQDLRSRYMQIVGSLMYVGTVTRPDIMFVVGVLARYMGEPTGFLMRCAERVLLYLAATADFALVYRRNIGRKDLRGIPLTAYTDSDHGGDIITRKSTTGTLILFYGNVVYWRSKRQPIVTNSSTEAELVAASATALQQKWLKHLINEDLCHNTMKGVLCCDNEAAVKVSKDPIASDRTKHIAIKHRIIQELIDEGHMQIQWVSTKDQLADMLTKSLDRSTFEDLRSRLGVEAF